MLYTSIQQTNDKSICWRETTLINNDVNVALMTSTEDDDSTEHRSVASDITYTVNDLHDCDTTGQNHLVNVIEDVHG